MKTMFIINCTRKHGFQGFTYINNAHQDASSSHDWAMISTKKNSSKIYNKVKMKLSQCTAYQTAHVMDLLPRINQPHHNLVKGWLRCFLNFNIHSNPNIAKNNNIDSIKMKRDCVNKALSKIYTSHRTCPKFLYLIIFPTC